MNKFILLLFFIMFTISAEAYSKKVFIATFSTQIRAQNELGTILNLYPTIQKLSKKHQFNLKVRDSGKYFIIVAEVFHSREVLNTFLSEVRKRQPGAFVLNHKMIKKEIIEVQKKKITTIKTESKEAQENLIKDPLTVVEQKKLVIIEDNNTTKVKDGLNKEKENFEEKIKLNESEKIKTKPAVNNEQNKREDLITHNSEELIENKINGQVSKVLNTFEKYFTWGYFILFIAFIIFVYYFMKFKRIFERY